MPHLPFENEFPEPNILRFRLNPDRIELGVNINGEGDPFDLERATLDAELAPHEFTAYSRMITDILKGDAVLSIRADETEESWRIAEPILEAWANNATRMREYPAGSNGPSTEGFVTD